MPSSPSVALPLGQQCRVLDEPLPTPSFGQGGGWTLAVSNSIAASPDVVLAAVLDPSTYPEWNRFIPKIDITSQEPLPAEAASALPASARDDAHVRAGTRMTFTIYMAGPDDKSPRTESILVTRLEPVGGGRSGWRVAWRPVSMPKFVLHTERVQEFVDDGKGGTEYYCWETFYGLLAPVLRSMAGAQLVTGFGLWGDGLKEFSEGRK